MATTPTLDAVEDIILYGKKLPDPELISKVELHSKKENFSLANASTTYCPSNGIREVTRSITLHFTAGYKGGGGAIGWNTPSSLGTPYVIELDGTLFQYTAMDAWTTHNANKGPLNSSNYKFSNSTSLGVEIAKLGLAKKVGATDDKIKVGDNISFTKHAGSGSYSYPGTDIEVNLDKIPFGTLYKKTYEGTYNTGFYKVKTSSFEDDRNYDSSSMQLDVLYPEEQMKTIIFFVKAMCEHYEIAKLYLTKPETGKEFPWIDVNDLIQTNKSAAIQKENKEKVLSFNGVMGHCSTHNDRMDPGPGMDYYRLKRGISDEWWYPINKDNTDRPLNLCVTGSGVDDYVEMPNYGDLVSLEEYYKLTEDSAGGYYPIGANKTWHGGVHLPMETNQSVYAVSNGLIVAARVVQKEEELNYSQCFILVKHYVHYKNTGDNNDGDRIDYSEGAAGIFYSLYMHLKPCSIEKEGDTFKHYYGPQIGEEAGTQEALPIWLNHYILDNPTESALETGDIIYPNVWVLLGDKIGIAGKYIVGETSGTPTYGETLHFEIFSKEIKPEDFAKPNPWENSENQIDDVTDNGYVSSLEKIKQFVIDSNNDGIDNIDLKNAAPGMRKVAVKHRSEWTLDAPDQLADKIWSNGKSHAISEVFKQGVESETWIKQIKPLMFYNELSDEIKNSVFGEDKVVWQYHPFTLLEWMNKRVKKHENILRELDKPRSANKFKSTIEVEEEYVDTFLSPVGQATTTKAKYNEQDYDVKLVDLADPESVKDGNTTTKTRFHRHLLEFLDHLDDKNTYSILETFIDTNTTSSCGREELIDLHRNGDCVDIKPITISTKEFYKLYQGIEKSKDYISNKLGTELVVAISYKASSTENKENLLAATNELDTLIANAANENDPSLNSEVNSLSELRFHIGRHIDSSSHLDNKLEMSLTNTKFVDSNDQPIQGDISVAELSMQKIQTTLTSIAEETDVEFMFIGRHVNSGKDEKIPGKLDVSLMHTKKMWTGVEDENIGELTADFKCPSVPLNLQGKLKSIACYAKVAAGAKSYSGKTSTSTIMDICKNSIKLPYIKGLFWSSSASSLTPIDKEKAYKDKRDVWVFIKYGNLSEDVEATLTFSSGENTVSNAFTIDASSEQHVFKWKTPGWKGKNYPVKMSLSAKISDLNWNIVIPGEEILTVK